MLKKFILNLRRKPKSARDKIALTFASIFTAVIFVVWIYHAPVRMAAIESKNLNNAANESPGFSELFGALGETVSSFKEEVDDISTTSEFSAEDILLFEDVNASLSTGSTSTSSEEERLPAQAESFYNRDDETSVAREIKIISVPSSTSSEEVRNLESAPVD